MALVDADVADGWWGEPDLSLITPVLEKAGVTLPPISTIEPVIDAVDATNSLAVVLAPLESAEAGQAFQVAMANDPQARVTKNISAMTRFQSSSVDQRGWLLTSFTGFLVRQRANRNDVTKLRVVALPANSQG